jgi:hypothetical protein
MVFGSSRRAIVAAAIVAGLPAERVAAHGFQVPSTQRSATGVVTSGNVFGVGNNTPAAAGANPAPAPSGVAGSFDRTPGSAPRRGGAPRGSAPFGLRGIRRSGAKLVDVDAPAGRRATPAELPSDAAARGRALRGLLIADLAGDSDFTYVVETTTTDARLRTVALRMRIVERRRGADVRRRVEIEAKRGDVYERVETGLLRRVGGRLEAATRTVGGAATRFRDASAVAVAGTTLRWADLAAFEPTGEFRFVADGVVDGAPVETFSVRTEATGEDALLTVRMDTRLPLRREMRRAGLTHRAIDWSGWRFYAGRPVAERLTVTGAAGETTVLELREAGARPATPASDFEVSAL